MTPTKQFWALFKFQSQTNLLIWYMPLMFAFPMFMNRFGNIFVAFHPTLFSLIFNPFLIGYSVIGAVILGPERLLMRTAGYGNNLYTANEFILTRAVDRPVLYRARVTLLYLVALIIPLIVLLGALPNPDVVVEESSSSVQQATLAALPGSTLLPPEKNGGKPSLIAFPRGNIVTAEWRILLLVMLLLLTQVVITLVYPLRHSWWIFWLIFVPLAFGPFMEASAKISKVPTVSETAFFAFAGHQVLFLALTALAFIITQLWCERRFARTEF